MIYKRDGAVYSCYQEYCMICEMDREADKRQHKHKRSSTHHHKGKRHKKEGREMNWQKKKQLKN